MTVTKNEDGTFDVTFTARQLELVVARLGLNDSKSPTGEEEYALYRALFDGVESVGVNTNPIAAGLIRFEDLTPGEKLIAPQLN